MPPLEYMAACITKLVAWGTILHHVYTPSYMYVAYWLLYNVFVYFIVFPLYSTFSIADHSWGTGDDSKDANSDSKGNDSEDANSDYEGGSSEVEGEDDVPLKSTDNVIIIYVDDSSNDVATQTDPSELGLCDLVIQRLDKVLAIELISSEMGVTMYILWYLWHQAEV